MLPRGSLLLGLTGTLACARPLVDVRPTSEPTIVEVGGVARLVHDPASAPMHADDPVRDVVYTEPGELPRFVAAGAQLPLKHTHVDAHLRGELAEVVVTQRFENDGAGSLEAIYTFPLPENSAVTAMTMKIGARVIAAEIRERNQAQQVYQSARAAGHTAALLEQERPNIFTQSVANIPAGAAIEVEIRYLQTLSYDAGEYEFVFPTVVGPRYLPGEAVGGPASGSGGKPDTDRVPDASRISPPILGRGERTGHDLSISVTAEASSPITAFATPAHAVDVLATGARLQLRLAARDSIPNRDFVLRYRSAGPGPVARMFVGPAGAAGGHFMLVAEPPRLDVDTLVGQRELIFVVDVSGSMSGPPLGLARATLRAALAHARPVDTFDVITFAGRTARLFGAPRPASAANVQQALEFIDGLVAGGGTEMAAGVDAALDEPVPAPRHRYVFFLTDGFIGEEAAITRGAHALIARQERLGRRARVFGVGIGAAPNEHLIAALSRAGKGVPLAVRQSSDVARAVGQFQRMIDAPVLTSVSVDWGGLAVADLYPVAAPDLFASHPLVLHGRYTGAPPTSLQLRGRVGERTVSFPIQVSRADAQDTALTGLWARARVGELEMTLMTAEDTRAIEHTRRQILELGLAHHLVTSLTSLVAVDRSRRISGVPQTLVQPVEVPQGVDPVMAGAASMLPVGGTSRDFTAVLDMSPTATRDSAGVRLGGTSGAESRYTVDGSNATSPAFGTASAHIVELPREPPLLEWRGLPVEPHARVRLREVQAPSKQLGASLRELLQADKEALGECFTAAPRETYQLHRRLVLVLHIGPDGRLARLQIRGQTQLDAGTDACLRQRLDPIVGAIAAPGAELTIDLTVWMRY